MLRIDGDFVIYIIQFKHIESKNTDWHNAGDCEHFIPKGLTRQKWDEIVYNSPFRNLNACGECWQKTGIKGSFDFNDAQNAMLKIAQWNKGREFRVAQLKIKQETIQLSTVKF